MHLEITLDTLKGMLKDKQQQVLQEPSCKLWQDEVKQLTQVIELVQMEKHSTQ